MSSDEPAQDKQPPARLLSPLPPLFGLLTPLGGADDFPIMLGVASPDEPNLDVNEQVFMPHQTPLRRSGAAYSPLPDDLAPLEPPQSVGLKRKRLSQKSSKKKKKKRVLKKRMSKTIFSSDNEVILRSKRDYSLPIIDPYYAHRYERVAEIDDRLKKILTSLGSDFFLNKTVLDVACGRCAFIAFYIAAYLGASRVVACDSEFDSIMSNLRQLRKFKHDGIRLETSSSSAADQYPAMLVKRCGPVPITNKPWRVLPQFSCAKERSKILTENFPYNIEFNMINILKNDFGENRQFNIVLVLGYIMKHAFITGGTDGLRQLFGHIQTVSDYENTQLLVETFYWRDIRKKIDKNVQQIRVDNFLIHELGFKIKQRISPTLLLLKFPPPGEISGG